MIDLFTSLVARSECMGSPTKTFFHTRPYMQGLKSLRHNLSFPFPISCLPAAHLTPPFYHPLLHPSSPSPFSLPFPPSLPTPSPTHISQSLPLPISSLFQSPYPSPPLNSANGSGERCELPQRGLELSPSRNRIWYILVVKSGIRWQQFWWHS